MLRDSFLTSDVDNTRYTDVVKFFLLIIQDISSFHVYCRSAPLIEIDQCSAIMLLLTRKLGLELERVLGL